MISILLSILIGILLGLHIDVNIATILVLVSLCVIGFFLLSKKRSDRLLFLCLILFFISIGNVNARENISIPEASVVEATVVKKYVNNKEKYILKENGILPKKYLCYSKKILTIGDRVEVSGKFREPDFKMNFGGFDNRTYLKTLGVHSILYADKVNKLEPPKGYNKLQNSFFKYVEKSFDHYLNEENSSLMKSIVLADNTYIEDSVKESFKDIGVSHILALSGLHISIILFFCEFLLKLLKISKLKRKVSSLSIVFLYIMLIGFPIGALRAYLMSLFLMLSYILKVKNSPLNSLFLSAGIILLLNPYSIFSVSFLMSYGCVFGLIVFYSKIKNYIGGNPILDSISASIATSIIIFPICIYFFKVYPLKTFISNIILVPIYSGAIILSYGILILNFIGFLIAPALNLILNIAGFFVSAINSISLFSINTVQVTLSTVFTYYLIIFIVYFRDKLEVYRKIYKVVFVYYFIAMLISGHSLYLYSQDFRAEFLYVDQGDCSIISSRGKTYMVDTGGSFRKNFRPGEFYTLNYLKSIGVKKIEKLFISHFDEDHINGLLDIIDKVEIGSVYVNYVEDNIYLRELLNRNIPIYKVKKNDIIYLDDKTNIKILSNPKDYMGSNDKSMVMLLNHRGFDILYTGDVSSKIEDNLNVDFDLLKVSHHGSKNSTSDDFISKNRPKYAAISAGVNNIYSHPSVEVMDILNKYNVDTKVTSEDGQIELRIDYKDNITFRAIGDRYFDFSILFTILVYTVAIYLFLRKMVKECNIEIYIKRK